MGFVLHAFELCCRVDINYKEKGPGADEVLNLLQAWWQQPLITDKAAFISAVTAAPANNFSSVGTHLDLSSWSATDSCRNSSNDDASSSGGLERPSSNTSQSNNSSSSSSSSRLSLYHGRMADTPDWFKVSGAKAVLRAAYH
jgi:hypothetical protein